jgi:hypothetical protein
MNDSISPGFQIIANKENNNNTASTSTARKKSRKEQHQQASQDILNVGGSDNCSFDMPSIM